MLRTADEGLIGTVASAAIRSQSPRGSFAPSLDGSLVGGFSHQVEGEMRTTAVWLARKRDWCSLKVTSRGPAQVVFNGQWLLSSRLLQLEIVI